LPHIIAALAPEYPKFIEQKMASDSDEIRYCHRDERRQKPAEEEDHRKVDQCHCTTDGAETNKPENSFLIQHGLIPGNSVCSTSENGVLQSMVAGLASFVRSHLISGAHGRK
jgi:hypothetical protein